MRKEQWQRKAMPIQEVGSFVFSPEMEYSVVRKYLECAFLNHPKSLDFDLFRVISKDFRAPFVVAYLSGHANMFVSVCLLGIAELRAVTPPDQHRENLVWVWLIEIDERRISLAPCCVGQAGYPPQTVAFSPSNSWRRLPLGSSRPARELLAEQRLQSRALPS
jgi:hypothetical protein